jgi:hypothetical protein
MQEALFNRLLDTPLIGEERMKRKGFWIALGMIPLASACRIIPK